jgi:hypothetical protein
MKSSMPRSAKLLNEFVSAGPSKPPAPRPSIRPAITPLRQQAGADFTHFSILLLVFIALLFYSVNLPI